MKRPCENYPQVYDELHESSRTPEYVEALEAARSMCGTCLLNTPDTAKRCLRENRSERWVKAILGKPLRGAA